MHFPLVFVLLALLTALPLLCAAQVQVVEEGKPMAVVVTAAEAPPVARYAANELVSHIEKATGARLPVVAEAAIPEGYASRIYVGATQAARAQGIEAAKLPPETFVMRTVARDLYIVGDEDDSDPLSARNVKCGTLFGVYEFLDRFVGVRWLWPGELGTYVPQARRIRVPELDETIAPKLRFRNLRWNRIRTAAEGGRYDPRVARLAFTPEGVDRYSRDLEIFLRRHRMGGISYKPPVGHAFAGWWERYGKEHPDWFMLNAEGKRGPVTGGNTHHVPMCVSNPNLHRYLLEQWDGESPIRLGEVDVKDFCRCPNCRAWDTPPPDPIPDFLTGLYQPMGVSDRYARFWLTIQQEAAKRNPEALVTTFLYWNYLPAPKSGIRLNRHIYGEFVPWGESRITYFPMRPEALEWLKQQWLNWKDLGIRIAYRPNHLHGGYTMPYVDTRQFADFFQFAFQHGMEGTDFDSLLGQWATQGPKYYLHLRLHVRPEAPVEQLLQEYYAAFGPAAKGVEAYFTYWETYARERVGTLPSLYSPVNAHKAYPAEAFEPAERLLEAALATARTDPNPDYAARVEFLQKGLQHARLCTKLSACFGDQRDLPPDSEAFRAAQRVLKELVDFRRATEHLYISDFVVAAGRERRWWNVDALFNP